MRQTDCAGWTVGDLVTHVIGTTMMYAALLGGATAAEAMSKLASATTTPASAISDFGHAACIVQRKLNNPDVVTGTAHHPAGDVTGNQLAGYAMVEWVLHGWDLSTATRQNAIIGFDLAQASYEEMVPDVERLRRLGAFGPAIPVSADAPFADRLVALLGRAPS
ncbi:MAG: TIGR03086 family metal-binding protein [Streptosporangiales bacterium]